MTVAALRVHGSQLGRWAGSSQLMLIPAYGWLVRLHQPVRMRLHMTCHYFNGLFALAIVVSIMLVCAGVFDFNDLVVRRHPVWHFIVQDTFFVVLGLVAIYGSLWVTANLTNYWLRFVQRINELLLTHSAAAHLSQLDLDFDFSWLKHSNVMY